MKFFLPLYAGTLLTIMFFVVVFVHCCHMFQLFFDPSALIMATETNNENGTLAVLYTNWRYKVGSKISR